jgi:hypothetical protein
MVLYQCDICGGICLENQIIFLTVQIGQNLFMLDLCPKCFDEKFDKVKLNEVEIVGGDDEKSFRDRD